MAELSSDGVAHLAPFRGYCLLRVEHRDGASMNKQTLQTCHTS